MKKNLLSKICKRRAMRRMLSIAGLCVAMFNPALKAQSNTTKICSASDIHYFDPSLLISNGSAFQAYLAQDRKLIAESKALTEALVSKMIEEKPSILLITGDLTKDGEKICHQKLAGYLSTIEANGTSVFVIPGNHDVYNVDAASFDGATTTPVENITPAEFKSIYDQFGYGEATSQDASSLSYLAKPSSNLWVLGIDVCRYDENLASSSTITAGRFKPATYQWVLDRLAEAKAAGATVIGMMHHGLTEHYTGQSVSYSEYVVAGWDTISRNFANAGLKLMFTGHYHANDITKKTATGSNFVYDIETGSLVTAPCPYRVMYMNSASQTLDITTKTITEINYDTKGKKFADYAKDTLTAGLTGLVSYTLQAYYHLTAASATILTPHVVKAYVAHYAGDEQMPSDEKAFIAYLNANGLSSFGSMLTALWTDLNPSDNNVLLNLSTGIATAAIKYSAFENFKSNAIGTYSGIDVRETGGSGLFYIPGSKNEFYTLGDRGPNIDASASAYTLVNNTTITDTKVFAFPQYNPKIFRIALRNDSVVILDTKPILRPNGNPVSGLPNPISMGNSGEGVLTENTQAAHDAFLANPTAYYDTLGIDCEGVAMGKNKDLWIADEYGVSVWRVDRTSGKMLNRYTPYKNLDAKYNNISIDTILAKRRANRGFENIAITPSGKVYALLQSPMYYPADNKKSRILRMLEIDPQTNATRMFAYLLPAVSGISSKDWKIGDMVAINNSEFLILAHGAGTNINRIVINKLDIKNATPIITEKYMLSGASKTLEELVVKTDNSDSTNLKISKNGAATIVPIKDTTFLELYNESYPAFPSCKNIWNPLYDKPEGLAIVNDSTLALTYDNDFGFSSSSTADGSVTANNLNWRVMLYNLNSDMKIKRFTLDSVYAKALELKVDSNYNVPSWFAFKRAFAIATTSRDSASYSELAKVMNALKDKNYPYSITASFNGSPKSQMGFAWFTNANITDQKVQLVKGSASSTLAFAAPDFTFAASTQTITLNYNVTANSLLTYGIADNTKKTYVSNKALATGLTANTTYSYRVGKDGAWSEIGTFTTAPDSKDAFSFVYFTDPQANTESMFDISQKTTHAAMTNNSKANFWLSCGDLVETSGTTNAEWEYEQFFTTQQDIWYNKPFVPVAGNHDKTTNKNFSSHFNTNNPSFDKTMSTTPGSVYSFVYGDALFMALSYEDYSVTGYLDSLANWMTKTVAANPNVKWRIAFYHKTMYTGSQSHQSDADGRVVREKMGPVFDKLKIDLAIQGHDHVYEVMGPIKNFNLVDGMIKNQTTVTRTIRDNITGKLGGTYDLAYGTLYFLNNSAGKKKYEPRDSATMKKSEAAIGLYNYFNLFTGRFGQTGEPTFSNISVSTDTIKISTYTVSDLGVATIFDSYKIVKSPVVSAVALSSKTKSMLIGEKSTITATVTPTLAVKKSVEWFSLNPSIATVSNGEITAVGLGKATIIVKSTDGTNLTDTCKVTVSPISVIGITLSEHNLNMVKGASATITATVLPSNATNQSFSWSTSDSLVLSVVNGNLTALKAGTAMIRVKTADGSLSDSCSVVVAIGTMARSIANGTISVYPNPVSEKLTVRFNNQSGHAVVSIVSINGLNVYQQVTSNNTEIIDVTSIPKGIYILKIVDDNQAFTQRLVIE